MGRHQALEQWVNLTLLPGVSAGKWLPSSWSLVESCKHLLPLTLDLLSGVCHSVYDTPAGTAIRMNAACGAWGAQFPRAGGKSVTVRNQNDQILSELWQLLTTSHLLICSNEKLCFHQARNRNKGKFKSFQLNRKTLHMDLTRWSAPKSVIITFAAKDGEAPYSQQKQDQELPVAQIMNALLPNSDVSWRK